MMSAVDPVTQDRIYRGLKTDYLAGLFQSGERLDLQAISDRHRASKTPVREAIHKLMGERLVEPDPQGGFRVALPSAKHLIQIYAWNAHLLVGMVQGIKASHLSLLLDRLGGLESVDDPLRIASRTAAIFLAIAEASGNGEAIMAIAQINDRLLCVRIAGVDTSQKGMTDALRELRTMTNVHVNDINKSLRRRIEAYHDRRIDRQRAMGTPSSVSRSS
jgi:DNA-binding GntR family transcriptional regulator